MTKRNANEIEKDYRRIRKIVENTSITSISKIAKELGLSEAEVRTSLNKHPRVFEKILKQLDENKKAHKTESQLKKKQSKDINSNEAQNTQEDISKKDNSYSIVIDASITGIDNLRKILENLIQKNVKIILTSITIKELEKMQKFNDVDAFDARHILATAAENSQFFSSVLIDESAQTPDDCIIKYCAENNSDVILYTSDKTMALKARMYNIKTKYFKQTKCVPKSAKPSYNKINTLYSANKIGNKLIISRFKSINKSILLISNGEEFTTGIHELKINDDVYVASKKPDYFTFAHYQMISLNEENNCNLVFSKRIYDTDEILKLPVKRYKTFMQDFIEQFSF